MSRKGWIPKDKKVLYDKFDDKQLDWNICIVDQVKILKTELWSIE